jgi:GAF domain-containing protein
LFTNRRITIGEGVTGWVLANRQPFCNADPRLDLPPQLIEYFADYRTLASFPLINEKELHGAITLYSSKLTEYNADHRRLLQEAATLLTASLLTSSEHATPSIVTESYTPTSTKLTSELAH